MILETCRHPRKEIGKEKNDGCATETKKRNHARHQKKERLRHPRKVGPHQLSSPAKGESSRAGTANVKLRNALFWKLHPGRTFFWWWWVACVFCCGRRRRRFGGRKQKMCLRLRPVPRRVRPAVAGPKKTVAVSSERPGRFPRVPVLSGAGTRPRPAPRQKFRRVWRVRHHGRV